MATPTKDQVTQCKFFSTWKLLNEDINNIKWSFTPSKFNNNTVIASVYDHTHRQEMSKHYRGS